jgi:hypothetical protein
MKTLKELKSIQTYEDLENLGIGRVYCDISHRGGGVGFYSSAVAEHFEVEAWQLSPKFGAGCNYLGGGLRGSIFGSTFSNKITGQKAKLLSELSNACVRVYENIENGSSLNDEEDENGETNWEAMGTNASRRVGIVSAY